MIELFDLSGKTAILTGGAGGIGRALALGMAGSVESHQKQVFAHGEALRAFADVLID